MSPPRETRRPGSPGPPAVAPQTAATASAPTPGTMRVLRGLAVSPGVAIGPPCVLVPQGPRLIHRTIAASEIDAELERLDRGLAAAAREAEAAEADARRRLGPQYADILAAHVRMIGDESLLSEARQRIGQDHLPAELAVFEVLEGYARRLDALPVAHLAARAADVRDIRRRILDQLLGQPQPSTLSNAPVEPVVVLAPDLSPSETAALDPRLVLGFATEAGGQASHTAIVAAALEIPAVAGLGRFLDDARGCARVIVDGDEGLVVLDPDAETLRRYRKTAIERAERFQNLASLADLPALTRDGTQILLLGNIEFAVEATACVGRGADGIGLYRTEFLFLNADQLPDEDEQTAAYESVVRAVAGRPVTIRTLDLGSDKLLDRDSSQLFEMNPSLGLRSLRRSLRDPEAFKAQLRAILRAAALGNVRVMFPLVTTVGELRHARRLLLEAAQELQERGIPHRADIPVGAMIEVPAAAIISDLLSKEVDFFSIGTNDLIQYTLAADRSNETVADLYCAADPAVLRLIAQVASAARDAGIELSVCGSIAGDPLYTLPLLGLGVRQLSTPPHQLPEIKRVVRAIDLGHARSVAQAVLRCGTADEVLAILRDALRQAIPDFAPGRPGPLGSPAELNPSASEPGQPYPKP